MGKKEQHKSRTWKMSKVRKATTEVYISGENQHNVHALVDFDITKVRKLMKKQYEKTGVKLSFSAFIINCVGKAVSDNKRVQALRKNKTKLTIFDDVDIVTLVEREIDGEFWPIHHVIRSVAKRPLEEIHKEIRYAQQSDEVVEGFLKVVNFYMKFPRPLRILARGWIKNKPKYHKEYAGTVLVTSVGISAVSGGWGIPFVGHPLVVTVGGMEKKPKVINDKIEIRECVNLTLTFDHDVLDGAPAARFTAELKKLIENGYGVEEVGN